MATISSRRATTQEMTSVEESTENAPSPPPIEDSFAIHEKLVAYVHAINSDPEPRSGVWMEHSYARGRGGAGGGGGGGGGGAGASRSLLVRRARYTLHDAPRPDAPLDVDGAALPAPLPPDPPPELVEEEDMEEDEWEEKLVRLAPSVAVRRAAGKVAAVLKSLRLSRLVQAGGRRDETRSHARLLRRALAPLWASGGGGGGAGGAAWLWGALPPALPPHYRALLTELAAELARTVPALCALLGGKPPPPAPDPYPRPGPAVMPTAGRVLLVWVGSGRGRSDARWTRRFRPLLPTHYVRIHNAEAASPAQWVLGAVQAVRRALSALSLARDACSGVCVGGAGGGALLARHAAAGDGRVKAVLQLGPGVQTAEGAPAPGGGAVPCLSVVPEGACSAWRAQGGAGALLAVGGVDAHLRMSRARRRHLRLPQHALDAALADECARWLHETLEGADSDNSEDTTSNTTSIGMEIEDEEFAHLPSLVHEKPAPTTGNCSIEIVEGRVISRGAGGTPLALLPPRRAPPAPAPGNAPRAPAPAPRAPHHDIMSLPVVLADDAHAAGLISANNNHVSSEKVHPVVTVKGGGEAARYTKVIVAKRSAHGGVVVHSEVRLSPAGSR